MRISHLNNKIFVDFIFETSIWLLVGSAGNYFVERILLLIATLDMALLFKLSTLSRRFLEMALHAICEFSQVEHTQSRIV